MKVSGGLGLHAHEMPVTRIEFRKVPGTERVAHQVSLYDAFASFLAPPDFAA